LWRTPTVEDAQDRIFARNGRGEPKLSAQAKYGKNARWPTPSAADATCGPGHSGREGGLNLRTAVRNWPTPTSITETGGASLSKWGGSGARKAMRNNGVTEKELNGPLNPSWVEWLMNWPIGWSSAQPVSNIDPYGTPEWWAEEPDIPRIATGIPNRTKRLQALGNGQVPLTVATAWRLLTGGIK
jgi:DNA (cytosine-5)-methyltransferase 1